MNRLSVIISNVLFAAVLVPLLEVHAGGFKDNLMSSLENAPSTGGYDAVNGLFSAVEALDSQRQRDTVVRRSTGWQAEKFAAVTMHNMDMRQNNLFNQLTQLRTEGIYDALSESVLRGQIYDDGCSAPRLKKVNPWTRWVSWDGNAEYLGGEGASYGSLQFDSAAANAGIARKVMGFGRRAYFGLNFSYNYGHFRDHDDREFTKGRYDGFTALAGLRVDKNARTYWTDWTLGWSVNNFAMDRKDYTRVNHHSETPNGVFRLGWNIGRDYTCRTHAYYYYYEHCRLSPIAGFDYSALAQGGLHETGRNGLALNGDSDWMHSFRPKAGLEFAYKYTDVALTLHSYIRYECLDKGVELPMEFATAPAVRYRVNSQDVDRVSGIIGFNTVWQLFENQDFGFSYDGLFIDGGSSHWFNLRYVKRF